MGVLAIAFPVPVIVNNFTYYYTLETSSPEPLDKDYACTPLGERKKSDGSSCVEEANVPSIVVDKVNGKSGSTSEIFEVNANDEKTPLNVECESNV